MVLLWYCGVDKAYVFRGLGCADFLCMWEGVTLIDWGLVGLDRSFGHGIG